MNINTIYQIIDSLAADGKAFSNEQDFQFEFARKLDLLDEVAEVKLEVLSLSIGWNTVQQLANKKHKLNRDKKEYTDIVVKMKNGEYITIELKMKTPDKICYYDIPCSGKVLTLAQGAYDINAFEFIKDINRLENINNRTFFKNFKISKGYAIMLTNYSHYRFNNFSGSSIWMNYAINDGRQIVSGKLTFENGEDEHKFSNKIYKAIEILNSYLLKWRDYKLSDYNDYEDKTKSSHPGFSYLVVEVPLS